MTITEIGRVGELYRYPVKSMRGEAPASLNLGWTGFDGDRQYAFYRADDPSRFPWLTGRDVAELVLYAARYDEPSDPRRSPVAITAPGGAGFEVRAPELAARLSAAAGRDIRLLQVGRSTFDSMPVSVIGRATLDRLGEDCGRPLATARFRPNIVVEGDNEQAWLGGTLLFGDGEDGPRLRVNRPIPRCRMITIDPANAVRDPAILRTVVEHFANEIGVYCAAERPGIVNIGDRARLMR